ncbi:Flagellar hook-associated protein 1 [Hartmannibacter diazotrophicus]|uniref:Flagellar hook-associated protein 1 n=1 Tax=Hartmannibacter diazotrophicus TaxID=1482074 RepID=A0A2C9D7L4_9HYPH|nr:flagellar hook-associated protein FlgK [Hartmannibacter diazotrophicus]SON56233.1 Flagellar hook-associated protein 1 [Hartmannibacter diazotrophicus]
MSITTALRTSLTGLNATQRELELVANNIANASSAGYTRKTLTTSANVAGNTTYGVSVTSLNRELNTQVQTQWRSASAANAYASTRSDMMLRLDALFGQPGSDSSIASVFSAFTSSMEALATSPEDTTARTTAVASANNLTSALNSLSNNVQSLRNEAETGISEAVDQANSLLAQIEKLDKQIVASNSGSFAPVGLLDQRDYAIDQLSELMDVKVQEDERGHVSIYTSSGASLFDVEAAKLDFNQQGVVTADKAWSSKSDQSTLGSVTMTVGGSTIDLFAEGAFRSGTIAAYKSLRDDVLPEAQAQLDELASQMALAVSNRTETGTAVTSGSSAGFDLDTSSLLEGNTITLSYDEGGETKTVTFVATDGTATVDNTYTANPNDTVFGIDISGGAASIATQIGTALGANFVVSNPSGDTLRVLDDGTSTVSINSLNASVTETDPQSGNTALALFTDSGADSGLYTGLIAGADQKTGLAGRIQVNKDVISDPSLLVAYSPTTAEADAARPTAIVNALLNTEFQFSADTGIGSRKTPFGGTIDDFLAQVISTQGAQASQAESVAAGQDIVTANLEERYSSSSEVNVDTELARLVELQTAYQANARVMKAAQDMIDALFGI